MLLGDPDPPFPTTSTLRTASPDHPVETTVGNPPHSFNGSLDVLHAVSAALIDGTWEILMDSDFENVMKVLTSWVPIRDEELLMRVAKAEWKLNRKKK
jgi:hypothetical protein